jgi:hypothetical protein
MKILKKVNPEVKVSGLQLSFEPAGSSGIFFIT